jgi:hypothetical protein
VSPRRAVVGLASALLLLIFVRQDDFQRLRSRARTLAHSAQLDGSLRRLNGTSAAFDRQFFVFLESARRRLPPSAAGVAILGAPESDAAAYLAAYHLAPLPVVLAPRRIPPGWLLAVYGPERPPGWKVIAEVWRGALMAPTS